MNMNQIFMDNLQIALELNILIQSANNERKKDHFTKYIDLLIKEALKIQEYILLHPNKEAPLKTVLHWLESLLKIEEDLSKTALGILLKEFLRKHTKELEN